MLGPGVPQIHDFNPGITPSGLFWTIRVPDSAVKVNPGTGEATFALRRQRVDDYYNLANALAGGPSTASVASFVVTWKATGKALVQRDDAADFEVKYRLAESRVEWSAQGGGFAYESDPAKTSAQTFAMIGQERNGAFFP